MLILGREEILFDKNCYGSRAFSCCDERGNGRISSEPKSGIRYCVPRFCGLYPPHLVHLRGLSERPEIFNDQEKPDPSDRTRDC